jgi:hypothetical protein
LGPDVAGAVWPLLEHEDRLVRQAAVTLYADKADTAHFGAVYGLHERSEHPEVQRQMRKSMELMLREEPVRLGTWLMKKDDYKVKAWGVAAIAHGGVEALPFLIQSLELPEEPTREDVAHYRLLLRAIGASAAQARERDDIPKLLTAYRRLGRQHQDLVRRPLVHLAHESPEPRLDDFKFFTYVNVFKIRGPDGRWPRDFNY